MRPLFVSMLADPERCNIEKGCKIFTRERAELALYTGHREKLWAGPKPMTFGEAIRALSDAGSCTSRFRCRRMLHFKALALAFFSTRHFGIAI